MLQLILGRKKSGKTHTCFEIVRNAALSKKEVILLVPEQFSFECQQYLLKNLGATVSNRIQIHSFTSLCEAICANYGGICGDIVDESTRFLLTKNAISSVKDNLKIYNRYYNSSEFINKVLSIISELKQANISADSLIEISNTTKSENFKDKLFDIFLIFKAYDSLVKNSFIEPYDLIDKTVHNMVDNSFFAGKTVVIDEFKGFTEAQFKLLDRIIAGSSEVYASFCCDSLIKSSEIDIFANVKSSANRLIFIANSHGVTVKEPFIAEYLGNISNDISALENILSKNLDSAFNDRVENIFVCKCDNVNSEIDYVFKEIRRLVREENYRYRDIVIISRSEEIYKQIIENTSSLYNVPCYTDSKIGMYKLPLSIFIISSISAAISLSTEDIIKALKTGLFNISFDDVNKLENYVFMWGISGKKWLDRWNMSPLGLKKCDDNSVLDYENLRLKVVEPLQRFKNRLNGTVTDMCRALLSFFDDIGTISALKNYTEELEKIGKFNEAEYQRVGYDCFIKTIDKICSVMGDQVVSQREFSDILSTAFNAEKVGEIPQTKDRVIFGTADRIRPMRPKIVFVVGANQDVFPALVSDNSLLSRTEREEILNYGFNISDCSVTDCLDEQFLFYSSACCASNKVYFSYSLSGADGSNAEPSYALNQVINKLVNIKKESYLISDKLTLDSIEAIEPSFEKYALNLFDFNDLNFALREYFLGNEKYKARILAIERAVSNDKPSLSANSSRSLYGSDLKLSASKIDVFNSCKFMYFCRYGLNLEKLNKVDFDPLTRGNIIHFVLEKFVNNHKHDIGKLDKSDIINEVYELCEMFLKELDLDNSQLNEKFSYMLSVLKDTAVYVVCALNNEFAQSDFRPSFCELRVGNRSKEQIGIDTISVEFNGGSISLNGSIDRVDTTEDGKIRVIDYKTGTKDFRLSSVLSGMNMQMLLYLYIAVKNGKELLKADRPAGILYFPANRNISENENSNYVKMNGLIEKNVETVHQMEKEGKGKIIPATLHANTGSFYKSNSIIEYEYFDIIFKYLELALKKIGIEILKGNIAAEPLKSGDKLKCDYCDYKTICKVCTENEIHDEISLSTPDVVDVMKQEVESNGN